MTVPSLAMPEPLTRLAARLLPAFACIALLACTPEAKTLRLSCEAGNLDDCNELGQRLNTGDHVLRDFAASEQEEVARQVKRAAEAVTTLMTRGLKEAMNRYNRAPRKPSPDDGGEDNREHNSEHTNEQKETTQQEDSKNSTKNV